MKHRILLLAALVFFIMTATACSGLFSTPIEKILNNPRDYVDKRVTVSGTVVDSFNVVILKYFIVRDKTGEIPVITDKPVPAKGQKIKVSGTVRDAFSLGDDRLIVLVEESGNAE